MSELPGLRAAVAGTGFLGVVHVQALRRLDVEIAHIDNVLCDAVA
jgi:hypothetical protein